jgi:CubicO group peptidase (beta-lactamase class C family)
MRLIAVLASILLSFSASSSLNAQQVDPKAVDRVMTKMLEAWQIPGAAVAVVVDGEVVHVKGYGTTTLGGSERVTGDTLFQIASTTKAFTSTAVAMLASEEKLSFDDPVRQHLDYFRLSDVCADSQVTIRDILTHRTGLTRHDELWDNTPLTREEVVRAIGHASLAKPFRTTYQYQNITFITAGEIVAKVSGMPWDDFVRTRIFRPLGMTRTVTSDADWAAAADKATGYRWYGDTGTAVPQKPISTTTIGAGGAIKSSARDMAQWIRFQLANGAVGARQLLAAEQLAETKMPHTVIRVENATRDSNPETTVMAYAMGWVVQDYRGEQLVSHPGALNGFRTHVDLLPRRNSGFVVMINSGRGTALVAARNALADLLSKKATRDWNAYYLMLDRKAQEKELEKKKERAAKRIPATQPTLPLDAYAGSYENAAYGKATIAIDDGKLALRWHQLNVPLAHYHYDVFDAVSEVDWLDEQLVFDLTPDHRVKSFTLWGEEFVRR